MKFTDGFWRTAPGMSALHPRVVRDVVLQERGFTVFAAARPIENRRNTLNNPLIAVTVTSPALDVVKIRISHHDGRTAPGPFFALAESDEHPVSVRREDDAVILETGDTELIISTSAPWDMRISRRGRLLTASAGRSVGVVSSEGDVFVHERLALGLGESVYGLGERSTPLIKNGQSVDTWNDDGGPSSWHSYKSVPFFVTSGGWGVLVNSPGRVSYEVGSEIVSEVQFSVPGESLEYVLFAGSDPKAVLRSYTALTGRPALPPTWSFGLWLTTSFVTEYNEETVTHLVDEMARRDIPLSVFHFDSFWMREFHWCDFEWDPEAFPDPGRMLSRLHERGVKTSVWINPYIAQRSRLFAEAVEHGYLLRRANGDVWQTDTWQAGMGIVDFTDPAARRWYASKIESLLDMGVDAVKTDFGERIPTDVVFADGSDPASMHNYYSFLYNETVFDALERHRGTGDAVVFARASTVGGQRFPVHWGGDPEPTFRSMAETLRAGLSFGLSGFGFWSHDIGGFEGEPSPDLFMRWAAFGLLSSHSRLHGSIGYRVPWRFGEEAVEVVRSFTRLKMRLMPYLYGVALEAHTTGLPMMRAMMLEFPDDQNCRGLDRQYMLGPDVLVAPVLRADDTVEFYVPEGGWRNLLTGAQYEGPAWFTELHGKRTLPLLTRKDRILPLGAREDRPGYDFRDDVTLYVTDAMTPRDYDLAVADPTGRDLSRFEVAVHSDGLDVEASTRFAWNVMLVDQDAADWITDGSATQTAEGVLVSFTPATGAGRIVRR